MQHKRERDIEARIDGRRYCFGGDSKGGSPAMMAPTPAPPPPDLGPDTALAAQNEQTRAATRKGAAYTRLTGKDGTLDPAIAKTTLGGGTQALLG